LDAGKIAAMSEDDVVAAFRDKPALHRFPGSMGKRTHALCRVVVDEYDGDAARIWRGVEDPQEVLSRLKALPGYGDEKAKILLAVLGKRFDVAPAGWEKVARPFGDATPRSAADVDSPEALQRVRAWKKDQRAQGKTKAE
jgi:uncharacterized HhH-GPD family protein